MRKYSQTTGSCYIDGFHTVIPVDAVDIPDDRYEQVIANPEPGKVRSHDADGLPILIDPPPATADELAAAERRWRDAKIESVRWLRERHRDEVDSARPTTLTAEQSGELLDYVQALRDWPLSLDFPSTELRPASPPWIAEQVQ
ncbi:phage tail protein [Pseudomonas sp. EA_15y_Pfl2_R67]|uniref:phage tail protein n=1 Tax=Pseudomonas sp. EA_15y_Pfl2_R67 TaxID=3088687 RepID=UPI0030DB977B